MAMQDGAAFDQQGDVLPTGAIARLGSTRFRHEGPITCQAVTLDGNFIATGGGRGVRVWDAATGRLVHALAITQNDRTVMPTAVAFSIDGSKLAALGAYSQGIVTVWDLRGTATRQDILLAQREDYSSIMMDAPFLAFSGNPKQLLLKNYSDKSIRVIDLPSGTEVRSMTDAGGINCVVMRPDGKFVTAGTDNRQIITWDTNDGKEVSRWTSEYGLVSLAYSPSGMQLASLDQDLAPTIWNTSTGKKELTLPARSRSINVSWSADGNALYVARLPDQIVRWNTQTQKESTIQLPRQWVTGPVTSIAQAGRPEMLMLGSSGRRGVNFSKLRLFLADKPETALVFDGYDQGQQYVIYSALRKQWLSIGSSNDSIVRAWGENGQVSAAYDLKLDEVKLRSFASNAIGAKIGLSDQFGRVYVIDTETGTLQKSIQAFPRACYHTEFSLDGKSIITTDLRWVKIFSCDTGALQKSYELHSSDPIRTIMSPDGTRLATMHYAQDDEQVVLRFFDTTSGKVLATNMKLANHQQNFAFSHDGRSLHIVTSRGRSTGVSVVETATGKQRFQADLPAPYFYTSSQSQMSPDGRWLVTPANGTELDQHAVIVWKMGSNREPYVLTGHRGAVSSCHFSSDSKQLLTVCNDSTMLVWDLNRWSLPTEQTVNEKEFPQNWSSLASNDAAKAYSTICRWASQPQAAEWLGKQIMTSSTSIDKEQIKVWIKQLDAAKFQDREQATRQLIKHACTAKADLKLALVSNHSPESKRRLEQILSQAEESTSLSENPLQFSRGLEALELMGTAASLEQLQLIAKRTDSLGQEAREAATRLGYRLQTTSIK
jgi:WD40 repeat protein